MNLKHTLLSFCALLALPQLPLAQSGVGTLTPDADKALHVRAGAAQDPLRLEGLRPGVDGEDDVVVTDANGRLRYRSISDLTLATEWRNDPTNSYIYAFRALNEGTAADVVVTDAGDFGIGTTTPAFNFDLFGTAAVRTLPGGDVDGSGTDDYIVTADQATGQLKAVEVADLISQNAEWIDDLSGNHILARRAGAAGNTVAVTDAGYLGIGNATPQTPIHITTGADVQADGSGGLLRLQRGNNQIGIDDNEIQAFNNGTVSPLFLQNDGSEVRIGSSSPGTSLLHAYGKAQIRRMDPGVILGIPATDDQVVVVTTTGELRKMRADDLFDEEGEWVDNGSSTYIYAKRARDEGSTDYVVIDDDGQMGIGLTNPQEKLTIDNGGMTLMGTNGIAFNGETPFPVDAVRDGSRIYSEGNVFGKWKDALVIEKTDFNNAGVDGGIVFANRAAGNTRVNAMIIDGASNIGIADGDNDDLRRRFQVDGDVLIHGEGENLNASRGLLRLVDDQGGDYLTRDWATRGVQVRDDGDYAYFGLKREAANRMDAVAMWGNNNQEDFRFIQVGGNIEREVMTLAGDNRYVGIGVTDPQRHLHVGGQVRVDDLPAGDADQDMVVMAQADGDLVQVAVADLFQENEDDDWVIAGNDIYNANTGNIGVGVTNPAYKLDLGGSTRLRYGSQMVFGNRNENHIRGISDTEWRIATRQELSFVEDDGATPIMTVRGDRGNVGVGTTTPDAGYGLHIATRSKVGPNTFLQFGDDQQNRVYSPNLTDLRVVGDTRIGFRDDGDTEDVMTVQTRDERVGIRTTTPGRIGATNENVALDINGRLRVRDLPNGDEDNDFFVTADGQGDLRRVQLTEFEGPWIRDNANNVRLRTVTDQVGIGLTNPTSSLHIFEPTGTTRTGNDGTIVLQHGNNGGMSSIVFRSAANAGSDHAYIQYEDDASGNGATNENGLLTIGIENDVPGTVWQDDIAIMSSGYVGVGTTAPANDLHVAGGVRIDDLPNNTTDAFAVTSDNNGDLHRQPISSIRDNLGNHDMTLDLVTGNNSIRYARDDAGPDQGIKLTPENSVMVSNRFQMGNVAGNWIDDVITDAGGNPVNKGFAGNDGAVFAPIYTGGENSDLRLYILDNPNDAFSVWGNPCGSSDCGEINNSEEVIRFRADGEIFVDNLKTGGGPDQMVVADANGNLKLGGAPGGGASTGGDNLGNHVAALDIILGANEIRGQGDFRVNGGVGGAGTINFPNSRGMFWGSIYGTAIVGDLQANGEGGLGDLKLEARDDIYLQSKGNGGDLLAQVGGGVVMKARNEFRFSAGTNNTDDDFRFYTDNPNDNPADNNYGQERFRIQNNGEIRIQDLAGGGNRVVMADNDGILYPTNGSSDGLWTRDNGNQETYLDNFNDQVGIGTANPFAKLHVTQFTNQFDPTAPGATATEFRLENQRGNGAASIYFKEGAGGDFGMRLTYDGAAVGGNAGGGRLQVTQADGTPYASFERTGEVGFGVVDPEAEVHIMHEAVAGVDHSGLLDPATLRIQNEQAQGSAAIEFVEGDNAPQNNSMSMRYHSTADGSENHFEILRGLANEGSATRVHFRVERDGGAVTIGDLATGAGNPDEYVVADENGVLSTRTIAEELLTRSAGNETYVSNLGDAFGIGTASPTSRLHVAGNARIETFGTGANTDEVVTRDAAGNLRSVPFATLESPWDRSATDGTYLATGSDNVGIGTSTPGAKLDVVGTTRVSTLAGVGDRMVIADAAGQLAPQSLAPYLSHWRRTDGATVDYLNLVNAGDRVGIGTTGAPQATLHVVGTSRISSLANATNGEMVMANASGDLYTQVVPEELWLRAGTVTQLANGGDRVGIGTGTPAATLDVNGDVRVDNMVTATGAGDRVVVRGADGILRQAVAGEYDSPWVEDAGTNRVTLKNRDRWVGIGTDAPASAFHVEDDVNGNMEVRLQNRRGAGAVQMRFRTGTNSGGFNDENNSMTLRYSNASDALEITNGYVNNSVDYASHFKVRRNNGNVGINVGAANPAERLHVIGNGLFDGDLILEENHRLQFDQARSYVREVNSIDVEVSADDDLFLRADDAIFVRADGTDFDVEADRDIRLESDNDVLINARGDDVTVLAGDDMDLRAADQIILRTGGAVRGAIQPDGRFQINDGPNDDDLHVLGRTRTDLFRLQDGAQTGYVLQSVDNNGNANWVDPLTLTTAPTGPWTRTGTTATLATGVDQVGIGTAPAAGIELDVAGDVRMRSLANNSAETRVLVASAAGDLSTRTVGSLGSDDQQLTLVANSLSLEDGGTAINLAPYLDNTDAQDLSLTGDELALTNDASTVNLAKYLDNTDAQALGFNPATGLLTLTNGGSANLSGYANTDAQDLELSGNSLSLTNDGTPVDLAGYLDNTDAQALGFNPATGLLTLTNGGSANLSGYANTDAQDLELTGNSLTLTNDGTPVDLSGYLDNTDAQDLSLAGNTLSLTNDGTPVDLSAYVNTDAQDLELTGNTLSLTNDGTTVDLGGYLDNTDAQTLGYTAATRQITLTNGGSVTLPADSDSQDLGINGTTGVLTLSNDATPVDLSAVAAIDDQVLSLTGKTINLERGGAGVDLTPLLDAAEDDLGDHTATETLNMNGEWINGDADLNEGLFITPDGDLGVNVAAPTAALHVGGEAQIDVLNVVPMTSFLVSTDLTGRLTKITPADLGLVTSDSRLKNDITPIEGALAAIDSLSAVSFTYKPASETGVQLDSAAHYGVIAQEVQKFFPHAVKQGTDGYLRVNYDELVGVLLASSKELKSRNAELESQVSELQASVKAIEAFIAARRATSTTENTTGGNE